MRFERYINEDFNVLGYVFMFDNVNEVSDEFLVKLQKLGHKMGLKVRKSRTFQEQLKRAGKGVLELMKLVFDYSIHADVMDKEARQKLEADMKTQFSKVKKEDVISFIVNIDKTFLGVTSIPRHVLQNVLGITITSYDNWESNKSYIEKNMRKIITVLGDMGDEEDLKLAKRIYNNVTGNIL